MNVFLTDTVNKVLRSEISVELSQRHYKPNVVISPAHVDVNPDPTDKLIVHATEIYRALYAHEFSDMYWEIKDYLDMCDVCVACTPTTPTMLLELGIAIGKGKHTIIFISPGDEVDLLFRAADVVCVSIEGVLAIIDYISNHIPCKNDIKNQVLSVNPTPY